MFEHFRNFPWVLDPLLYEDQDHLLAVVAEKVIAPAEAKAREQTEHVSARTLILAFARCCFSFRQNGFFCRELSPGWAWRRGWPA